jgi:ankyrin repeat protein
VKPDLFCAAGLNQVEMLRACFDSKGRAIPGSSQTGSTRYDADGKILPSPPPGAVELASDALYVACRNGRAEAVRFLLDQKVDLDFRAYMGGTPLHRAYFGASTEVVKMLLEAGANSAARDHVMRLTPRAFGIFVPAGWGHMTQLKRVLRADPTCVNIQDARGTALHEAARTGHLGIAKTLLKAGADPTLRDADGKTPAEIVDASGHADLAKLLTLRRGMRRKSP